MNTSRPRTFARPQILRQAGRPRLERFLQHFAADLAAVRVQLPDPALTDEEYYCQLASLLLRPDGLPERLNETLYALEEMATAEGQERLEHGLAPAGLDPETEPRTSRFDFTLEAWMAAPELFAEQHRRLRMTRLSRFEYYASRTAPTEPVIVPGGHQLERVESELDSWFAQHRRGRGATRVECHSMDGELWFLIRHGDTFTRTRAVQERRTEVLQYRPERDDVVVYSRAHDELRINARTRGERQLYREAFGALLCGQREHFCEPRTHTLEPLRERGASALEVHGVPGIRRVTLRELKVQVENGRGDFNVAGSDDLFRAPPGGTEPIVAPERGKLARAAFDFEFVGSPRPRTVEILPPNVLKLGRHCDARIIGRFFCCRGFRRAGRINCNCAGGI